MGLTRETEYIAASCLNCGMINVIKNGIDGCSCAACGGGPLRSIGYAMVRRAVVHTIEFDIEIKREQLDRLMIDVKTVANEIEDMAERLKMMGSVLADIPPIKKNAD